MDDHEAGHALTDGGVEKPRYVQFGVVGGAHLDGNGPVGLGREGGAVEVHAPEYTTETGRAVGGRRWLQHAWLR